jgi:hypothetical protein
VITKKKPDKTDKTVLVNTHKNNEAYSERHTKYFPNSFTINERTNEWWLTRKKLNKISHHTRQNMRGENNKNNTHKQTKHTQNTQKQQKKSNITRQNSRIY